MSLCTTIEADHYGVSEASAAFYHCLVISVKFISTSVKAYNDRSACEGLTVSTVIQYMARALTLFELYYLRLWPLCLWNKNSHTVDTVVNRILVSCAVFNKHSQVNLESNTGYDL